MDTELATIDHSRPATVIEIKAQVNLIQQLMRAVMLEGTHFGTIPGCGDKPTLLKAGAEKILSTFRIAVTPEVEDLSTPDEVRFRVKVLGSTPNGIHVGTGIGECSSSETKFRWRESLCDDEFQATDDSRKRVCWRRGKGGTTYTIKQIRTQPSDLANTVLKMAKKRGLIDMTLTATAASDIFTQDLEDLPSELVNQSHARPIRQPQKKVAAAASPISASLRTVVEQAAAAQTAKVSPTPDENPNPAPPTELSEADEETFSDGLDLSDAPDENGREVAVCSIEKFMTKEGKNKKGQPWKLYTLITSEGWPITTFDATVGKIVEMVAGKHVDVRIVWEQDGKYKKLISLELASARG